MGFFSKNKPKYKVPTFIIPDEAVPHVRKQIRKALPLLREFAKSERKKMGDFKKNPDKPFEVRVPNKIRKRIAMHEQDIYRERHIKSPMERLLSIPLTTIVKKRGSLWSRFINKAKKFLMLEKKKLVEKETNKRKSSWK